MVFHAACHGAGKAGSMNRETGPDGPQGGKFTPISGLCGQLQVVVSRSSMPLALFDTGMRYVAASEAWWHLHGLDGTNGIGACHDDLAPHAPESDRAAFRQGLAGTDCVTKPSRIDLADGPPRWLRHEVFALRTRSGEVAGLCVSAEDVTERRDLEQRLQTSERRLQIAMELGEFGLFEKDLDTGDFFHSPGMERFFFTDTLPADLEGWMTVVGPGDVRTLLEARRRSLDPNGTGRFSIKLHPEHDGQTKVLQAQGRVRFDGEGTARHPVHLSGVILDRTESVQMSDALANAQRLESVGRMAGMIAHDFNNLLTVILSNLEFAGRSQIDAEARNYLDRAIEATNLGANFNKRLLSLAGSKELHPTAIALDEHLANTWNILERVLGEEVHIRLIPAAPNAFVFIDPGELDGMILNLVINAREAMGSHGEISILTGCVQRPQPETKHRCKAPLGEFVSICVADSGRGMTPEVLARATEPFFTTKSTYRGNGLGLTSVASSVSRAGGFLDISSKPGKGTNVTLLLPAVEPPPQEAPAPCKAEMPLGNGEMVLVVEDDPMVCEAVLDRLEALGYAALPAGDVDQACQILKAGERIDLVFSDVILPGEQSGYDLMAFVKQHYPETAVVMTSGHTSLRLAESRGELQTVPLLPKPYSLACLAETVAQALKSRGTARP